jgi:hypothetical protein
MFVFGRLRLPSELLLGVVVNCARDWPFWKAPHAYYDYSALPS